MSNEKLTLETARFLRTLRVATQSAIVCHDLSHGGRKLRSAATFLALAAKGSGDWKFPAEGLVSADGLVLASLVETDESERSLVFQAQGAAGLASYMNLPVRLRFVLELNASELDESDLVGFAIETGGEAS